MANATVNQVYDQSTTPSGKSVIVDVVASAANNTYQPNLSDGKTLRIISLWNATQGSSGTAANAAVSAANTVTFTGMTDADRLILHYTST